MCTFRACLFKLRQQVLLYYFIQFKENLQWGILYVWHNLGVLGGTWMPYYFLLIDFMVSLKWDGCNNFSTSHQNVHSKISTVHFTCHYQHSVSYEMHHPLKIVLLVWNVPKLMFHYCVWNDQWVFITKINNASIYSSWQTFYQVISVLLGYLVLYHLKLVSRLF
jgi:hypothetical protein